MLQLRQVVADVGTWTSSLASAGKMAEKVPLVGSSAGSLLGFPDLVTRAVSDKINTLDTWAALQGDKAVDLGDGRTGTLKLTVAGDDTARTLGVRLEVQRVDSNAPFDVRNASPKLLLSSAGGIRVTAKAVVSFTVRVDKLPSATYLASGCRTARPRRSRSWPST